MGLPKLLIPIGLGSASSEQASVAASGAGPASRGIAGGGDAGGAGSTGGTVFEMALANHLASRVRSVCAVIPGWIPGFDEAAEKQLKRRRAAARLALVKMDKPAAMSASLKAGWAWVAANLGPDAVMISLADKPLVDAATIDLVIDAYQASDREICVPVYRGTRGHPVIIGSSLGEEVMALEGDRGAERVLAARRDRVTEVRVASDAILFDVDSGGDVETLRARLGALGRP